MEKTVEDSSQVRLESLIRNLGGTEELIGLLDDYRAIVKALARAADPDKPMRPAHCVVADVRTFWSKKQLIRMALDLPEKEGKLLIGR